MHASAFRQHRWSLLVGAALTLAAVAFCLLGLTRWIEWPAYDLHVRYFSSLDASDRIVHVDIDDDALNRVGSWPWPRDLQAELIRILDELGAERIVMDIVFSDPKPAEARLPGLDRYADIEGPIEQIGELSPENLVYPDDELAAAIREAGNVDLSFYYQADAEPSAASPLGQRITPLLREDFSLDVATLANRLGEQPTAIEAILAGIKRRVADERVTEILSAHPDYSARQVHETLLPTPFDRLTADRADVLAAYFRRISLRELHAKCPPLPESLRGRLRRVEEVVPPVYKFARASDGVGFVNFSPDFDGRTRHVPLLMEWDGRLIEQLGLAAARRTLGIPLEDLAVDSAGNLRIAARGDRPAMRVQLDDDGQMLLNWHVPGSHWQGCFAHLPVTQLLRIGDCRRGLRENEIRRQQTIGRALWLVRGDEGFEPYRRQVHALLEYQRTLRWAGLAGRVESLDIQAAQAEAEKLEQLIAAEQHETLDFIEQTWKELEREPDPTDPAIAEDYRRFKEAYELTSRTLAELADADDRLEEEARRWLAQLRPMVAGKVCFVGYTATAVADMVATPAFGRMPGVMVHSQVFNAFTQGRFRGWARPAMQVAVLVLMGLLMTLLTIRQGPRSGFAILLAVVAGGFLINAVGLFDRRDYWLPLLTALILAFLVWALLVLVRYLTTERQKRRFVKAVAQYVSPAMARRIADEALELDLSPVERRVSCFFSDLAGFTGLSEQLGPDGTRRLLNPYLEAMSAALHRHDALINKFMGDGIFAFFNPPILPCPDHERAACASALDCRRALRELIQQQDGHPLAEFFRRLSMRIGLAAGPVFVGDYGSESKLDYTCMGDTVNLAARLESANKQFGSAIMLADAVREAVGDGYVYRHLGRLQVMGKTTGVSVYELLGEPVEVDDAACRLAETFSDAVAAFARRDWADALSRFEQCLQQRPDDAGACRYLRLITGYRDNPPPDDWNATIELTEK
ncbi:MAG: CHASE2 domain-containing protein [Phycisphaerales bacterium]|nr:CHASE2 domain-containing protein [Phycisphaerales bacterium]